jgi:hypothetical protein
MTGVEGGGSRPAWRIVLRDVQNAGNGRYCQT